MVLDRFRTIRGIRVPAFIYGTAWKEARTTHLTELALSAGFRGVDTANQRKHYVEASVGEALRNELGRSLRSRDEVFLQTKFTYARGQDDRLPYDARADVAAQVLESFESSLSHLGTTYIDSYLLHGPSYTSGLSEDDRRVWRAMESLHDSGKVRLLGVSNVSREQLELFNEFARVKPAFVQNRCYARTGWDRQVRAFARKHDIGYQGFSLLTANAKELKSAAVERIRARLGVSTAELVFSMALRLGMFPLTGTSSAEHMQQDLRAFEIELEEHEVSALEALAG